MKTPRTYAILLFLSSLGVGLMLGPPLRAETRPEIQIDEKLRQPFNFAGFEDPQTTLEEVVDQLQKRHDVNILVNEEAFKADKCEDALKTKIAQPNPVPTKFNTNLNTVLKMVLARVPAQSGATFLIRRGEIEITTKAALRKELGRKPDEPIPPLVYVQFNNQTLGDALQQLSEQASTTLVLDPRAGDKTKAVVSATFLRVPVDSAIRVLADMADLKPVQLDNMIYLTSPQNAARLEKEKRRKEKAAK